MLALDKMGDKFKQKFSFAERKKEVDRVRTRYPDRAPVIVSTDDLNRPMTKNKFLLPLSLTLGQAQFVIKKHCEIESTESMMLMIGDVLPQGTMSVEEAYQKYKSPDGFMYFSIVREHTFG